MAVEGDQGGVAMRGKNEAKGVIEKPVEEFAEGGY